MARLALGRKGIVCHRIPTNSEMCHLLAQLRIHTVLLKLNPAVTVYVQRSHDHRNVAEVDWCYVAASSGKICGVNVSKNPCVHKY